MSSSGGAERLERMLSFLSMSSFFLPIWGHVYVMALHICTGFLGVFWISFRCLYPLHWDSVYRDLN
jgi:hypothetical protein